VSLRETRGALPMPDPDWVSSNSIMASGYHQIGTGTGYAYSIIQAPKTGNLRNVHFKFTTCTDGNTVRVSLQGLGDGDGLPNGIASYYRSKVTSSDSNKCWRTGIISDDGTDTGALKAVTVGEWLAVVWGFAAYVSGSFRLVNRSAVGVGNPYNGTNLAKASTAMPALALEYDDDEVLVPMGCSGVFGNNGSASTIVSNEVIAAGNEIGNAIVPPEDIYVVGWITQGCTFGGRKLYLRDSGLNVLASLDTFSYLTVTAAPITPRRDLFTGAPILLRAGNVYYATVLDESGGATMAWYPFSLAEIRERCSPYAYGVVRTPPAAFTPSDTAVRGIGLLTLETFRGGRFPHLRRG
jgi:hypothetical protein